MLKNIISAVESLEKAMTNDGLTNEYVERVNSIIDNLLELEVDMINEFPEIQ